MEKMNEFEARDYILGKKINSTDDIKALADEITEKFNYDYGVAPRCVGAFLTVCANYFCSVMGMTGFQAGFVMWDFILGFNYPHNKCGMRILDFDKLLYPQYLHMFKEVPEDTWKLVVEEAKKELDQKDQLVSCTVVQHWKDIANGKIPDGIVITKEE